MDKQQDNCIYDIYGNEIYTGDRYYDIGGMIVADTESGEDDIPDNAVLTTLVEKWGTAKIMEALGFERKVFQ